MTIPLVTMAIVVASRLAPVGITKLTDMGSILLRITGSNDCFLAFDLGPGAVLFTRKEARVGEVGVSVGEWEWECSSGTESRSLPVSGPHPHFCFRGIATLTPPQEQGLPGGHGQVLRGRPGFLTGTITRSLKWLHLVDR